MRLVRFALAVVGSLAGSAGAAGFAVGEGMTFSLRVGPVEAGRARLSVGRPERAGGHRVVGLHGEAHGASWLRLIAPLDDDYKVVFDADRLVPRQVVSDERGVRTRYIRSRFLEQQGKTRLDLHYASPEHEVTQARWMPGPVRDPMTALFALRARPLLDGEQIDLLVLDGASLYRADARVERHETLFRDGLPPEAAIRLAIMATRIDDLGRPDPSHSPRAVTLWLSDDERRLPLRAAGETDLGTAQVDLTSYAPPAHGDGAEAVIATPPTRPAALHPRGTSAIGLPPSSPAP